MIWKLAFLEAIASHVVTMSQTHSLTQSQSHFRDITVLSLHTGHIVNANHTHHANCTIFEDNTNHGDHTQNVSHTNHAYHSKNTIKKIRQLMKNLQCMQSKPFMTFIQI